MRFNFQPTRGNKESRATREVPMACAVANEGSSVEGGLEAGVAEFVVVVVVVVHRLVHLREIALDVLHGVAASPSRLGPGDPARVETLGDLQETGAPVPPCSRDCRQQNQIRERQINQAKSTRNQTKHSNQIPEKRATNQIRESARNETTKSKRKHIRMIGDDRAAGSVLTSIVQHHG